MLKLDDDTFLHLIHYYRDLQDLPRERAYYGNAIDYKYGTFEFIGGVFLVDFIDNHFADRI